MDSQSLEQQEAAFQPSVELLIDYVEGLTSPETTARIAAHLEQSDEDQAIVDGIAWFMQENGADRTALLEFLGATEQQQIEKIETPQNPAVPIQTAPKGNMNWLRLAAAIVVVLGAATALFLFVGTASTETLVAQALEQPYTPREVWRGTEATALTDLFKIYREGDYESFISGMETHLQAVAKPEPGTLFYLGIAYLYNHQADKAVETLTSVANDPDNRYQHTAEWYLSLAFFQAGRPDVAAQHWKRISQNEKHAFQADAGAMLHSTH